MRVLTPRNKINKKLRIFYVIVFGQVYLKKFEQFYTLDQLVEPFQTSLNHFRQVWTNSDTVGQVSGNESVILWPSGSNDNYFLGTLLSLIPWILFYKFFNYLS